MPVGHFPLKDRLIVVTGGGSGICLAFVRLAMQSGARGVLICDLRLTPEAESLIGEKVHFLRCDVANWRHLEYIPKKVEKCFGAGQVADIWIAGAAIFEPEWSSWLYDTEKEGGYHAMRVNAEHPMKFTRIAMRSCLSVNKPCVVLILSSIAGIYGGYATAMYCATKHAVTGFTKSMAQADIDESCKVVAILPGQVSTPLWTGPAGRKMAAQFSYREKNSISAEEVAEAMKEVIEDGEGRYPGGTLLGVSKARRREVFESLQGIVGDGSVAFKKWQDRVFEPVREVFRKERGARL
ncbi:hypothetical protein M409DRAFT_66034 [Zasmidium cellare ATCC 36951]|uniref:NAD(P)-binding protein n=1 Tax=Zasmidium cellare ATCC 36951 TaxID=1080233 RepID=A0A6A6CJN3_ZASCE|nr:uncharacterized protein M409DRAFT_66034 [Zasmidium cellare ATCC 36951]KAF2167437.1 hypothetical protein M409DRAFT_66034 [Zasmidium cellare ATCC 36951]